MELIADLGKIIVFLFLLLVIFLVTAKNRRKLPDYLFASFLFVTAIDLSGFFLFPASIVVQSFKSASILLQMPLYYLYVRSACYYNFALDRKHLLHALPFLFFLVLFIFTGISEQNDRAFEIITTIQYYCYIIAVFLALRTFKRLYRENYSADLQLTYKWLLQTTILFLIGNFFVIMRDFVQNETMLLCLYTFTGFFALFVVSWFVLNGLYRPQLFAGINIHLVPVDFGEEPGEQPEAFRKLLDLMETEQPYLDDALTLQKLAEKAGMSEKQLSLLINRSSGKHFFDFINDFRIRHAKSLLKEQPQLTVLEVLYTVGFNSKSSFYTAFKKETGLTPSDYRKSML